MAEITTANYEPNLKSLWALAQLVDEAPLDEMIAAAARADTVGALLDPTLYRVKAEALREDLEMLRALRAMQQRHAVIGDVRGGHGLFAVVEFVEDRATRAPLAPWPQVPALLKSIVREGLVEGVSFAVRGNLLLIAPPLVIDERDLADALALLDRLIARHTPPVP